MIKTMIGNPSDVEEELAISTAGAGDWDDAELIKHWEDAERALKGSLPEEKTKLQQRLVNDNNSTKSNKKKQKTKPQKKRDPPQESRQDISVQWSMGDVCMAQYSEDRLWYEATIVGIEEQRGTCVVEYNGYEQDVEEQRLSEILTMEEFSRTNKSQSTDADSTYQDKTSASTYNYQSSINRTSQGEGKGDDPDVSIHIPPPPPQIAIDGHDTSMDVITRKMLMSWYMAGYYAGFYKGMETAKAKHNTPVET